VWFGVFAIAACCLFISKLLRAIPDIMVYRSLLEAIRAIFIYHLWDKSSHRVSSLVSHFY